MSLVVGQSGLRKRLPFAAVNRRGTQNFQAGMQRHHLLPRQLLVQSGLSRFFNALKPRTVGFEDFRRNGLLLPSEEHIAARMSLPLHRGPHPDYNAMVVARVAVIEASWSRKRWRRPKLAKIDARLELALLQRSLRNQLLAISLPSPLLNRRDPLGAGHDFNELEAMAQRLWDAAKVDNQPSADIPNLASNASLPA